MTQSLKKVSVVKRKDPLNDFATLTKVGRQASRSAQKKALNQGVGYTYAKAGRVMKRHPDGSDEFIRMIDGYDDFPTLEEDLCQG